MKKIILTFFIIHFLASCSKDDTPQQYDDGKKYYKFSSSEYDLMINYNYTPNQVITYQNQFGEQLHFEVIFNETKKSEYCESSYFSGIFGGNCEFKYYYDNKSIRLKIIENQNANYAEYFVLYHFSKSDGIFKNALNLPIWNVYNTSYIDKIQNPISVGLTTYNSVIRTTLNINGHLFSKVVEIDSNSSALSLYSSGGILERNVNKIYYDFDFGIIQFDDINGKKWRVLYP